MAGTWQSMYEGIASPRLLRFIEFESAATVARNFQPLLVPGLLQTEDYARVILGQLHGRLPDERIDSLVEVRMKRQELLDRADAPLLFFVLDEAAIRRLVGGGDVMRAQLGRLTELAARPRITVEIVPFSAGAYPVNGSFVIQEFPDSAHADVLYLEGPQGEELRNDDRELVVQYQEIFENLRRLSLGPEGSLAFLNEQANGLALPAPAPAPAAALAEAARRSTKSPSLLMVPAGSP